MTQQPRQYEEEIPNINNEDTIVLSCLNPLVLRDKFDVDLSLAIPHIDEVVDDIFLESFQELLLRCLNNEK